MSLALRWSRGPGPRTATTPDGTVLKVWSASIFGAYWSASPGQEAPCRANSLLAAKRQAGAWWRARARA